MPQENQNIYRLILKSLLQENYVKFILVFAVIFTVVFIVFSTRKSMGFYVTLVSGDESNPNNSPTHFSNMLSDNVELSDEWKVGVSELSFVLPEISLLPKNALDRSIIIHCDRQSFTITLDNEHFENTAAFLNHISTKLKNPANKQVQKKLAGFPDSYGNQLPADALKIGKTKTGDHCIFKQTGDLVKKIWMSKRVHQMLGFRNPIYEFGNGKTIVSEEVMYVHIGLQHLYLLSDIVKQNQFVGGLNLDLLRTISIEKPHLAHSKIHLIFDEIQYVPVSRHNISSIEIRIADSERSTLKSTRGETFVVLHFEKNV